MATITTSAKCKSPVYRDRLPWWEADPASGCAGPLFLSIDRGGTLSGVASIDGGTPLKNAVVHLYLRDAAVLIDKQLTGASGEFAFDGLNRNKSDYMIVVYQSRYWPTYNAQVFDRLTPV